MLVCGFLHNFAHETAGAARTRLSLRPLIGGRGSSIANLGRKAARDREAVSDEYEHAPHFQPSSPRRRGGGFTLEVQRFGEGLGGGFEVKKFSRGVIVGGHEMAEAAI